MKKFESKPKNGLLSPTLSSKGGEGERHFELISFSSDVELANAAGREWLDEIENANRGALPHHVALSGGRIARRFFQAVSELVKARSTNLGSVQFFWGDERCVPPNDAESNFAAARELLLEPLSVPEAQIHRVRGEAPPQLAAAEAEAEICRLVPLNGDGQPILDLIFLGLGEEGHVASLFPGESEAEILSKPVYRPVIAAKPPPHRITLGYRAIVAARQVWVLASGPGKENALRESLTSTGQTPLARVLKLRSHTRIFSDIHVE